MAHECSYSKLSSIWVFIAGAVTASMIYTDPLPGALFFAPVMLFLCSYRLNRVPRPKGIIIRLCLTLITMTAAFIAWHHFPRLWFSIIDVVGFGLVILDNWQVTRREILASGLSRGL